MAHRLLGIGERHRAVTHAESTLVGRRWEMSAVEGLLDRAIDGHSAVVGVVSRGNSNLKLWGCRAMNLVSINYRESGECAAAPTSPLRGIEQRGALTRSTAGESARVTASSALTHQNEGDAAPGRIHDGTPRPLGNQDPGTTTGSPFSSAFNRSDDRMK